MGLPTQRNEVLRVLRTVIYLAIILIAQRAVCAGPPAGRVVWWGEDPILFRNGLRSDHTNGVLDGDSDILTNAIAVAARQGHSIVLKDDGTVQTLGEEWLGWSGIPPGLSNVVFVAAEGSHYWTVLQDGTVLCDRNPVAGLSNVTAIAFAGYESFLALKKDGTLVGFRFDSPPMFDPVTEKPTVVNPRTGGFEVIDTNLIHTVRVRGEVLQDVKAVASIQDSPLVLKRDGTVYTLKFQPPDFPAGMPTYLNSEFWRTPFQYTSVDPVTANGLPLSNIVAIAGGGEHALVLRRDGSVVAFGKNGHGETAVPAGLTDVVAISADTYHSLALKRDGTVVAWGGNSRSEKFVPVGLSNVVAIAAGGGLNLAITTGKVPPDVFIPPHGRLEEMALKSDLIFKGQAVSSTHVTNAAFQMSGPTAMELLATRFKIISLLKGDPSTNSIVLYHYGDWTPGPHAWGGGSPPAHSRFEPRQSYLVFSATMDRPDRYYSPPPGTPVRPGEFRQISDCAVGIDEDGATRTLDNRQLDHLSVKEAHWFELNLLLTDANPTNQLYAIHRLDLLSTNCATSWEHSDDFKRERFLAAVAPLTTNALDDVAVAALTCFCFGRGCADQIAPHANNLIQIADHAPSPARRAAAVAAFSGTGFPSITNSLPKWLSDPSENVRSSAVLLLSDFPGETFEQALRHAATDPSPRVRACAAEAIGNGKIARLLPTLLALFADPVGRTNPVPPLTIEDVEAGGRSYDDPHRDVHVCAGDALLKFDLDQVGDILKNNLNDTGFRLSFLCKLAEKGAGPWIKDMADRLEAWRLREKKKATTWGANPETYQPMLTGTYFQSWNIICQYLHELPPDAFADGKLDRILDVLEKTGTTGSQPTEIYDLYRMKGMKERAIRYRAQCERTLSRDFSYFFNQVDARYTNSPAKREP